MTRLRSIGSEELTKEREGKWLPDHKAGPHGRDAKCLCCGAMAMKVSPGTRVPKVRTVCYCYACAAPRDKMLAAARKLGWSLDWLKRENPEPDPRVYEAAMIAHDLSKRGRRLVRYFMGEKGAEGQIVRTLLEIRKATGMSKATIMLAIVDARKAKFLKVRSRDAGRGYGRGQTNAYGLTPPPKATQPNVVEPGLRDDGARASSARGQAHADSPSSPSTAPQFDVGEPELRDVFTLNSVGKPELREGFSPGNDGVACPVRIRKRSVTLENLREAAAADHDVDLRPSEDDRSDDQGHAQVERERECSGPPAGHVEGEADPTHQPSTAIDGRHIADPVSPPTPPQPTVHPEGSHATWPPPCGRYECAKGCKRPRHCGKPKEAMRTAQRQAERQREGE